VLEPLTRIPQLGRVAERHIYAASILESSDAPANLPLSTPFEERGLENVVSGPSTKLSRAAAGFDQGSATLPPFPTAGF